MRITLLDAMDSLEERCFLKERLSDHEVDLFILKELTIHNCIGCEKCFGGRCAIEDDMQEILRSIAKCDVMIFKTDNVFGGYSSTLKKTVDRLLPIGVVTYEVKEGRFLHPMRYPSKKLIGIGYDEEESKERIEAFKKLVEANGINFQCTKVEALVYKDWKTWERVCLEIDDIVRGM